MSEHSRGWKWWQKAGLAAGLVIVILLAGIVGFREPWIQPVPGVRTAMTRPLLRESDLGPDSAYVLLQEAIRQPIGAGSPPGDVRIWCLNWQDAENKFALYGWPTSPPPPAPKPEKKSPPPEDELEEDPMFAPLGTPEEPSPNMDPFTQPGQEGLPADHPALDPDAPWTREQWEEIQRLVKLYQPNIAALDRAIAAPNPQVPTADTPDFQLPYLSHVRELARWLSVSAQYRAATGDYEGAAKDVERTLAMAAIVSRGGCLINHLVTFACDAIAARAAWSIVTRHDVPPEVLKRLARTFLDDADNAEPIVEAMRSEALMVKACVQLVYHSGALDPFDGFGPGGATNAPYKRVAFGFAQLAGSNPVATARNLDACYQHLVAISEKPYSKKVRAEYDAFEAQISSVRRNLPHLFLRTRDPVGYILASMLLPALGSAHAKVACRDATLGGMAVFCAVEAYRRKEGKLPDRLEQLVPEYLPRIPVDPFDGKPFRYLKSGVPGLPPEAWAVYSVGDDFTDDGGTAHSVGSPRAERMTNPDLVWPSQDYPREEDPELPDWELEE